MTRWQSQKVGRAIVQAGLPLTRKRNTAGRIRGLLMRGVVTATYEVDNPDHPVVSSTPDVTPIAIYCDVLCYTSMQNQRWVFLKQVLVSQPVGGIHRGHIWKPRAATLDVTGEDIDLDANTNPANLDGDHVLVSFIDDNANTPVILRGIPHPATDIGNEDKDLGQRMKLKVADGDPNFWKHHGSYFGVTDAGDFVIDTTGATSAELEADGSEPAPPEDGSLGNVTVRVQKGASLTIELDGGNVTINTANGQVHLGADGLISPNDGVVHGSGIDSLTGATYFALGNASGVVLAKK